MSNEIEPPSSSPKQQFLRVRREPFEYGLLPIQKLIFSDGIVTLTDIKHKLILKAVAATSSSNRINAADISEILQISIDNAHIVLETLASILPFYSNPIDIDNPNEIDSVGVNVYDLILFLYIQSYKRLLPRTHKDSTVVSDVWPSTSAFDGCLSDMSPLQLVRSNSRRFVPSQFDEEMHQLSYLQKHFANIISLLADYAVGNENDDEAMVLTLERFEHIGFLITFRENGSEGIPLSQAAPFFANSDPEMPVVPVPAAQVHEWILQNILSALKHSGERVSSKETSPANATDQDVAMADAPGSPSKGSDAPRSINFVEAISKTSVVKQPSDLKGSSIKVLNCHDSVIYVLAPLQYATVYGCSDATVVLGAIGKAVRVEHCERVQVITAAKRICIANCRECVFFLGVNQRPVFLGDNHKLQVAPYNTFYPQLGMHMTQVGIDANINKWDEHLVLGMVDPHDSLSHPAGVSDVQADSAACLDPDHYTTF